MKSLFFTNKFIVFFDELLFSQSNQLEKLHLNDSNEIIRKRNKITNQYRHHPYSQP
jgi:hypothetical protein